MLGCLPGMGSRTARTREDAQAPAACQAQRDPLLCACRSTISAAVEDGDAVEAVLNESLPEFLPTSAEQTACAAAVPQLLAVLRSPTARAAAQYTWLAQPAAAHAPTAAPASALGPPGAATPQQSPPSAAAAPARQLNVGAADFVFGAAPGNLPLVTERLTAALTLHDPGDAWHDEECGSSCAPPESDGNAAYCGGWEEGHSSGNGGQAEGAAFFPPATGSWPGRTSAGAAGRDESVLSVLPQGPASEVAFLAVLGQQFPEYSLLALRDLFTQCGSSMSATVDTICRLEAELAGQMDAAHTAQAASAAHAAPQRPAAPEFTADDFPTLGGSGAGRGSAAAAPGAGVRAGEYASRAKKAASLATPAPGSASRAQHGAAWASSSAPSGPQPAPVWQSDGIQQFSTGAAVAQEYADARAAASDHARLRNACFQQATAAYLAGNKAAAKEMGRRGRWHNEQMKAAHSAAAAETFSRRNAAPLRDGPAAGGRGGGTPTIDLHGLHVSEALQALEEALGRLQRGGTRIVRVVVGVGHHAKGGPARLPQAVKGFLDEWSLRWRETYAGLLEVTLV